MMLCNTCDPLGSLSLLNCILKPAHLNLSINLSQHCFSITGSPPVVKYEATLQFSRDIEYMGGVVLVNRHGGVLVPRLGGVLGRNVRCHLLPGSSAQPWLPPANQAIWHLYQCSPRHYATIQNSFFQGTALLYHVRANQAIWHPWQCAKKQKYSCPGNSLYMYDNCTTTVPTHCQSGDLTPLPMPTVSPHAGMQNINHLILRRTYNTKSGLWPCHKGTTLSYNILCYCNTQLWLTHSLSCCRMSCHTAEL